MSKQLPYLSGLLSLLIAGAASAAGPEMGVGIAMYDNPYDLDDSKGPKVSLGYRYDDSPWGIELNHSDIDAVVESNEDGFTHTSFNTLYHFGDEKFSTYISGGLGSYAGNGAVDFAIGAKKSLGDHFQLRPQVGVVKALSDSNGSDTSNLMASVTLSYLFNAASKKVSAPVVTEPEVAAPTDADNDGVADSADRCVNTPVGAAVDSMGCALDEDNDSIADSFDQCPSTVSGLKVDEQGCPVKLTKDIAISLNVNFDSNSSVVNAEYFKEISKAANFLEQYENTTVIIEGHTDTRGSAAYNKKLSQKRADAVAQVLVNIFKVSPDRVSSRGYGEERPIADESTKEGLLKNRRVVANIKAVVESFETK